MPSSPQLSQYSGLRSRDGSDERAYKLSKMRTDKYCGEDAGKRKQGIDDACGLGGAYRDIHQLPEAAYIAVAYANDQRHDADESTGLSRGTPAGNDGNEQEGRNKQRNPAA